MKVKLWTLAWTLSEYTGIPLGKFSHIVFSRMIGKSGDRIK